VLRYNREHIVGKNHFISVSDFLSTDFITINTDDMLTSTIKKMLQMDVDSGIVMEKNTTRDLKPDSQGHVLTLLNTESFLWALMK